jgi:diamine N-acetyltransferase
MIDERFQSRGFGSEALKLILDELKKEGRYDNVEVCVKRDDAAAIGLYEKFGFVDSGYIDEDVLDSMNMICYLTEGGAK